MTNLRLFIRNHQLALLLLLCAIAVYGLSVYQKEADYRLWQAQHDEYFVESVPPMASRDAYYWLKMARDLDDGQLGRGLSNPTRGYPDLPEYHDPNLLAWLISKGAKLTGGDYYRSGLLLVSVLGGLFIFPLVIYFNRLDFGLAAIFGGLVGTFSLAYYQRSLMGYLDTDLLNLFFPLAVACFIMPMSRDRSLATNLGLAVGGGMMMYLYNWWYEQPALMLVHLVFILFYLLLSRLSLRQILLITAVFILASGPIYALHSVGSLLNFLQAYFLPPPTGQIAWPDIMGEIAEAQVKDPWLVLKRIHGFAPVIIAGLAGLIYLYVREFRRMVLVTPMILIGLWSLFGPVRFAMYLAPFIGVGAGVMIELAARKAGERLHLPPPAVNLAAVALMFGIFFATAAHTGFYRQPTPTIPLETTRSLLEIKKLVPRHSAMLTWWDIGYPLMEIGNFATYHDGSLHGGLRSALIAKALTSSSQEELTALLAYLEDHGFATLEELIVQEDISASALKELVFTYPGEFRGESVHILYTDDMIRKFGSISLFGTWDYHRQTGDILWYERWNCTSRVGNIYKCAEGIADLDRGVISDGVVDVPLVAVLFINNGQVLNRRDYHPDARYYLQIVMHDHQIYQVQVVEDRLFASNFNQQYLLGNYDRRYFEEIYNNFPTARVFRVLPQ
ncbi:STT3 domain-containing protein [Desulfurivibrio alkaliphilus]|uniref:Membrane protein required for N-linked glycosylation-like protein n=1 Tax=Desulfurivibrio alkaliphilus (strain DSM 19089 / UNIQEM U267 / AHT2) TaxID=589865 RepID=D6YZT5_DESAT|nr:STT3 domain-containing protein [Desulfurivibrio alkaliphilus]ADH85092.1 membrane protein required for N-linked glycosylation-like protein [Desulfurivibrio alkaliphilus AHT 2]